MNKNFFFKKIIIIIIIIIIIVIVVVVVVVDDDNDYWVYLPSDHLFQVYYKVRQVLLQSATAFLLQSATSVITKCDRYYKVRRLLQSATVQGDNNKHTIWALLLSLLALTTIFQHDYHNNQLVVTPKEMVGLSM